MRMGSNKNQDICIEYLTTYLQGEVARGHVGGGGGTDTIEFLLEKEGGFRLLALLIQGEHTAQCQKECSRQITQGIASSLPYY